jgi:rhodanese-related sulfurtransferase
MKLIFFILAISTILLSKDIDSSKKNILTLMKNGYTIVDIRDYHEWERTGVVPKAKTIIFFTKEHKYNASIFLAKLKMLGVNTKKLALISEEGKKSKEAVNILEKEMKNEYINLKGGYKKLSENIHSK